jgi:three-Cys-motif partner protein
MKRGDYEGREQAYVKHCLLRDYLQRLAFKVGQFKPGTTLNFIDGFSGPWDAVSANFDDSSPSVAAAELLTAKRILAEKGVELNVRCLFIERDRGAFKRLGKLVSSLEGVETEILNGEFEALIPQAKTFASSGANAFSFVFIDPTGWTGYGLKAITPLLRVIPCEVLINFMTKDITRFIDDEESTAMVSFEDLFGEAVLRDRWKGLEGLDREDAIVQRYCERIRVEGRFSHSGSTIVLNPTKDRTHYHLIYATRSLKGLTTFRDVERSAAGIQKQARAEAKATSKYEQTGQGDLFSPSPAQEGDFLDLLILRYRSQAESLILETVETEGRVLYDELVSLALRLPFVSESIVKEILKDLKSRDRISYAGLGANERSPKMGRSIFICSRR